MPSSSTMHNAKCRRGARTGGGVGCTLAVRSRREGAAAAATAGRRIAGGRVAGVDGGRLEVQGRRVACESGR